MSRRLSVAVFFLSIGPACAAAGTDDLNAAFVAALGQPAPVVRHLAAHAAVAACDGTPNSAKDVTVSLKPQFLVPLADARYALIINETTSCLVGGAPLNAVTVAYLDRSDRGWAVEHVWFEEGGLGFAGSLEQHVTSFGGAPLYFAIDGWSSGTSHSTTITVLALDPDGPQALGAIKGGAIDFPDRSRTDCNTTDYTASLGPPTSGQNRFSVTYEGWTAPAGKILPRHSFRLTADAVVSGGGLVTGVKTPDCMR